MPQYSTTEADTRDYVARLRSRDYVEHRKPKLAAHYEKWRQYQAAAIATCLSALDGVPQTSDKAGARAFLLALQEMLTNPDNLLASVANQDFLHRIMGAIEHNRLLEKE
jgi:hypothetical protein